MAAELFCVIMAGGSGERFWPLSRKKHPKQFLNLLGRETLIEQTLLRLQGFIPPEKTLIITNRNYVEKIHSLCPEIPPDNVIGEPCARDTAPCVALAAGIVKALAETSDPQIIFLPSDHAITNRAAMISDLEACSRAAREYDALATIGVAPVYPCTSYGYIECGAAAEGFERMFHVTRFLEKPEADVAERLLAQGNYKWNSGIFLFPLRTLCRELKAHAPELFALSGAVADAWGTAQFPAVLEREFNAVPKISIDYAIMEHASAILLREASFVWDDVGNWASLRNHFPADADGNVGNGSALLLDCRNCIVFTDTPDQMIAGIDLDNMVVVKTKDALLVSPSASVAKLKRLLSEASGSEAFGKFL